MTRLTDLEPTDELLADLNERFEDAPASDILKWAFLNLPDVAIAASFQVGGLMNMHLAKQVTDRVRVLFIQTGFHFPETLEFRDRIIRQWGVELLETTPTLGPERQAAELGPELYKTDPDLCCQLNRVLPLQDVLERLDGWITGLRRDQGPTRRGTPVFDRQVLNSGKAIFKISPLARWTGADVWAYAEEHEIPAHPLYEKGYTSIGCAPCTRATRDGEDERAGRWSDSEKTECGIHTFGGSAQSQQQRHAS